MTGTLHEDQYAFFGRISFNSSFSEKRFRQNLWEKSKYTLYFYLFLENLIVYGIM